MGVRKCYGGDILFFSRNTMTGEALELTKKLVSAGPSLPFSSFPTIPLLVEPKWHCFWILGPGGRGHVCNGDDPRVAPWAPSLL